MNITLTTEQWAKVEAYIVEVESHVAFRAEVLSRVDSVQELDAEAQNQRCELSRAKGAREALRFLFPELDWARYERVAEAIVERGGGL